MPAGGAIGRGPAGGPPVAPGHDGYGRPSPYGGTPSGAPSGGSPAWYGSAGGPSYGPPGGSPYAASRGSSQGPADGASYNPSGGGPSYDDAPGHTRAFTLDGADPYGGQQQPYPPASPGADGYNSPYDAPYEGAYEGPYEDAGGYGGPSPDDNVSVYRAGRTSAPPAGPRLHWKQLLSGIVLRPGQTFWQMRDHTMWGPALIVTFVYGLLAVFGFDSARSDVLDSTLTASIPWVITTGIAVVLCGLTLGAVTNTLARQLGGDGAWAPTIGLAMLITSLTDAPRLLFALFLGGGNSFVQLLGWLTWIACGVLLTSMVAKSHDLPWLKALGACSIQLAALLFLFKLPLI